jgi:hypothetical protein
MRIRVTAAMAAVLLCAAISDPAQTATPGVSAYYFGAGGTSCGECAGRAVQKVA